MDSEVIINQTKLPDKPIREEAHSKATFPLYKLEAPGKPISDSVVNEIQRATLNTFQVLGESTSAYERGIRFEDLIDVWARNEQNLRTFPRKAKKDPKMLVIVVSTLPVYDHKGREIIALNTEDNIQYLNLRRIDDQFAPGSKQVPLEIKASLAVVEEVIHYIQHSHWGRERKGNTDSMHDINLHIQDEAEAEAAPLKKKVYQALYPTLDIKVKGVDF